MSPAAQGPADLILGLDDTDMPDTPGTNRLARALSGRLPEFGYRVLVVLRHQLFFDDAVPYTSKNGSASILCRQLDAEPRPDALFEAFAAATREFAPEGADPALALARPEPLTDGIRDFAQRARRELVTPAEAASLAAEAGIRLETLAGREHGQVGALAAVALAAGGQDGRVIHASGWPWPDHLAGVLEPSQLAARGIAELREPATDRALELQPVRVRKRLRPAWRDHRIVLYVEAATGDGGAVRRALKRS